MTLWYERGEPKGSPLAEQIFDLRRRGEPLGPLAEAGRTQSGRPQPSKSQICEQGFSLRQRGPLGPLADQVFEGNLRMHIRAEEGVHPR